MGIAFWRKTKEIAPENAQSVAVTESTPLPVTPLQTDDDEPSRVQIDQQWMPPVAGQTITRLVQVPGIGTASAYADGDAFGTLITFSNVFRAEKCSGVITSAFLLDLDDEGSRVDVPIFIRSFTATADNSAFAPTDADVLWCRGAVAISTFYNWNVNQIGVATNVGLWVSGEGPHLYTQLVTRGTPNIAAGAIPWVGLVVVPD